MDWPDLKHVLDQMAVNTEGLRPSHKSQVDIPCPLAPWLHESGKDHRPSMTIKVGTSPSLYICYACGESGRLWGLVDSFASLAKQPHLVQLSLEILEKDRPGLGTMLSRAMDSWEAPSVTPVHTLGEKLIDPKNFPYAMSKRRTCEYLIKRKISGEALDRYDIRYHEPQDRVVFPVRNREQELLGAVGRIIGDGMPKYYNYFEFEASRTVGGIHCLTDVPGIIIVEGFFDILNTCNWANSQGYDVVCTWKAEMSLAQAEQILSLDRNIVIGFDRDEPGNRGWRKASKLLSGATYGLTRLLLPTGKDAGDVGKPEFIAAIRDASYSRFS